MCLFKNYPDSKVVFKQKLNWFEKIFYKIDEKLNTQNFFIRLDGAYENNPKMHFLHAYQLKANVPLTTEYPRIYLSDLCIWISYCQSWGSKNKSIFTTRPRKSSPLKSDFWGGLK
jgi:hypothetical protein